MARTPVIVSLLASVSLVGCGYQAPTFEIIDVAMTERTDEAYVLIFTVEGTNPNPDPLPLDRVEYRLSLNGTRVATANRSPQATLPANGTQRIELPAVAEIGVGPDPVGSAEYRLGATVTYQVPGSIAELFFDSKIRRPKVNFSESGTLHFDE